MSECSDAVQNMMLTSIKGKDLEELVLFRSRTHDEPHGNCTIDRCGVMANLIGGEWVPRQSLPDFFGALAGGREFIFDAKVCSQASYDMSGGTHKSFAHQLKYMRKRARFGVLCFILMHFNARTLATKEEPAFTILFPVCDNAFWEGYDRGEQKKITRTEAELYGIPVDWNTPGKKRKASPDIYSALCVLIKTQNTGEDE